MTDSIKKAVSLAPGQDLQNMVKALSVEGAVTINIARKAEGPYILLSPDSIQELHASGATQVFLEAMGEKAYSGLMLQKADELSRLAADLRHKISHHYLSDLFTDFTDFLVHWENWTTLLSPLLVQRPHFQAEAAQLQQARQQLSEAAFYYEDNVLCLDEIQYVMLPLLAAIEKKMRHAKQ